MVTLEQPLVVVIAGPNGAGKSTTAPRLLQGALSVEEFVNADAIAQGLSAFRAAEMGFAAGRVMLSRIRWLSDARKSFAFETTLASRSYARWFATLRDSGYWVHIVFLALPSPDLAVARVAERVAAGGHDVLETVIRRRFKAGFINLLTLYDGVANSWEVLDNSEVNGPRLVARRRAGAEAGTEIIDRVVWTRLVEESAR